MIWQLLLLILIMLQPMAGEGQAVAWTKTKHPKNGRIQEYFQVLQADPAIKQGVYNRYGTKGQLRIHGFFKENRKDSTWHLYDHQGRLTEVHRYGHGKKVGVWEHHIERGDVILRYDHGKEAELEPLIKVQASYPPKARMLAIEGTVTVRVQMDENCKVSDMTLVKKLGYGCDERALRCVRRLAHLIKKYNPAGCRKSESELDIAFRMKE